MADWLLRLRALLDEWFAVAVAALVVLALVGGGFAYTAHAAPATVTEERPGPSWRTAGWFNHSATVTENNSVYAVGTTLDNRSVYVTEIAPWLNGTYAFTYRASEGGELNGTVSLRLVLRGVEERRESEVVVWQTTRPLANATADRLAPGETIRVPFAVDMNRTMNRTEIIDEQLGEPPGRVEVIVRATVDLRGTVNGEPVGQVRTHALPVALESGTYRPDHPGTMTDRYESTRTVTVERTYGPLWRAGAPLLLAASLCGLLGLGIGRRQGRIGLSPAERELLAYEDDRADFDEWISTIRLPDEAFDLPEAEAESLGALVDFAIDTDNGVVEDPDTGAYHVVHDGYRYTYRPPDRGDAVGGLDPWPAGATGDGAGDEAATDDADPSDGDPVTVAGDAEAAGDATGSTDRAPDAE